MVRRSGSSRVAKVVVVLVLVLGVFVGGMIAASMTSSRRRLTTEGYVTSGGFLTVLRVSSRDTLDVTWDPLTDALPASAAMRLERLRDQGVTLVARAATKREREEATGKCTAFVTDALRFEDRYARRALIVVAFPDDTKYFCVFGTDGWKTGGRDPSSPAAIDVLCGDETDATLLRAVIATAKDRSKVPISAVVAGYDTVFEKLERRDTPTCVAISVSVRHPVWQTLRNVTTEWYDYDDCDAKLIRHAVPQASFSTVDAKSLLPRLHGNRRVFRVVSFPCVLCSPRHDADRCAVLDAVTRVLLDSDEAVAMTNRVALSTRHLRRETLHVLRYRNAQIFQTRQGAFVVSPLLDLGRPSIPVLEQYTVHCTDGQYDPVVLHPPSGVRVFQTFERHGRDVIVTRLTPLGGDSNQTSTDIIDGVRLRVGDRVELRHQTREAENGIFYVEIDGRQVVLRNARTVNVSSRDTLKVDVTCGGGDKPCVTVRVDSYITTGGRLQVGDRVALLFDRGSTAALGTVVRVTSKVSTLKLDADLDGTPASRLEENTDPMYACVTSPEIRIPALCRSEVDAFGRPKVAPDIWDRPCRADHECPFFQANRTYPNYRGGCIAGWCEMPLGVRATSYRTYDRSSAPMCHGCGLDTTCCARQKHPDYAFELDEFERLYTKERSTADILHHQQ